MKKRNKVLTSTTFRGYLYRKYVDPTWYASVWDIIRAATHYRIIANTPTEYDIEETIYVGTKDEDCD